MSRRAVVRRAIIVIAAAFVLGEPALANDAAHSLAEKFAGERKADTKKDAERKADVAKNHDASRKAEAARKEDAQLKAEAERKADAARKAEAARQAEAARKAEAKRRAEAKAAEDRRRALQARRAEEAEMLARARREADEMKAADEQLGLAEEARRLLIEAERERARAEALLAGQTTAQQPAKVVPAEPAKGEALAPPAAEAAADPGAEATLSEEQRLVLARAEELRRLTEKLRRVREIREARLAAQAERAQQARSEAVDTAVAPVATPPAAAPAPVAPSAPPPSVPTTSKLPLATAPAAHEPTVAAEAPAPTRAAEAQPASSPTTGAAQIRVTVLLVMVPGDRGIRRHHKVADPVLCTLDGCYVSAGPSTPAQLMPGRKALGFANTWGARAGACRDSLGCVFRAIELDVPGFLRPVDLRIIRHDRRRGQVISGDSSCRANVGRLSCSRGIYTDTYAMWVVPEAVAEAAGTAGLERALADGLNAPRSAELPMRTER